MEKGAKDKLNIEDLMGYMLDLFNNTDKRLNEEVQKLSEKDMELSDLDHYLEIHKLKSYKLARIGKLRKTLREERREIKNNIEIIETVKEFTDKYNNKLITGDIIKNLKEQKTIKERQENPTYKYRTSILERLEAKDEDFSNRSTEI